MCTDDYAIVCRLIKWLCERRIRRSIFGSITSQKHAHDSTYVVRMFYAHVCAQVGAKKTEASTHAMTRLCADIQYISFIHV